MKRLVRLHFNSQKKKLKQWREGIGELPKSLKKYKYRHKEVTPKSQNDKLKKPFGHILKNLRNSTLKKNQRQMFGVLFILKEQSAMNFDNLCGILLYQINIPKTY